MHTNPSPQKGDPVKDNTSEEAAQETYKQFYPEENISEGGEFLDDALRMKDQPLGETEKKKTNNSSQPVCYRHLF
jgi:hypothetical protein